MIAPGRVGDPSSQAGEADAAVLRVWVWHTLFAVSLLVPTVVTAIDSAVEPGPRTATVAIATVWAALYLTFVQRVGNWDHLPRRDAIGYFVLAIGFAGVLIVRQDVYFLVVYALYPQAFLFLERWRWLGVAAVTGVLALGALPRLAEGDAGATVSVIASAGLAVAIGYFIEGVHGQSRSRGQALDDLGRIHAATEAVAAARSRESVAAALRTHLGQPTDEVTITQAAPAPAPDRALVVPLATTRNESIVVDTTRTMAGEERRRWHAIGPHVAVVLDNLRLAHRSRAAGILEERERLAREVHDTLAQSLTSIVTQLEAADQALPDDLTDVQRRIGTARGAARDGLEAARSFVRDHRPVELVDATLTEALRHLTERWSETTSMPVSFHTDGPEARTLPPERSEALLRITQEALANIQKHAAAQTVHIVLRRTPDQITLEIRDDGIGFEPHAAPTRTDGTGFGLQSMRQRAERASGILTVDTRPGDGTTIRVRVPTTGQASS